MPHIVLISCAAMQERQKLPAKKLYKSPLFVKSLEYARQFTDDQYIFIISTKYGLVELESQIEPYDISLRDLGKIGRQELKSRIAGKLKRIAGADDQFTILAGEKYVELVKSELKNMILPLKGMRVGERLRFLNEQNGQKSS